MEFANVGAGWKESKEGKTPRISVKLENGMYMSIFKNTKKEKDNQPDYNLTMSKEDAETLGLVKDQTEKKSDEINVEEIPF